MSTKEVVIQLGDRSVNLSAALPFRLGDWRRLRDLGVDIIKMPKLAQSGDFSLEHMVSIASVALKKAAPELSDEAVNDLTLSDLNAVASAVLEAERPGGAGVDRPTSTASSSSPSSGAGDPATSIN